MEIKLYNSLTNKLETFKPIKKKEVSIYVCGPTVYNDPHIGNIRPVVIFDTLNRFLRYIGYDVKYVSNYTDIDDKIINKALEEKITELELSNKYIDEYKKILKDLNVLEAFKNPRVSDYMQDIIDYIDVLVRKGNAYVVDGEVFFNVNSVQNYGVLSKTKKEELISGARVETNTKKKSPLDFLLWKKTTVGKKWKTKWCEGRPGWHTECCVMIDSIFKGEKIDIHGGGMDLKFPHHENEIAQSIAKNGNTLATFWLHNAMMNIEGNKMSKSFGNVVLAKDAIKEFGADVIRLFLINVPYRSVINLNDETIKDTKAILNKIHQAYKQLNLKLGMSNTKISTKKVDLEGFLKYLANDLNIPNAITYLLDVIKKANQDLRSNATLSELKDDFIKIDTMLDILGLHHKIRIYTNEEKLLYNKYTDSKNQKNFELSDQLRAKLIELDIL